MGRSHFLLQDTAGGLKVSQPRHGRVAPVSQGPAPGLSTWPVCWSSGLYTCTRAAFTTSLTRVGGAGSRSLGRKWLHGPVTCPFDGSEPVICGQGPNSRGTHVGEIRHNVRPSNCAGCPAWLENGWERPQQNTYQCQQRNHRSSASHTHMRRICAVSGGDSNATRDIPWPTTSDGWIFSPQRHCELSSPYYRLLVTGYSGVSDIGQLPWDKAPAEMVGIDSHLFSSSCEQVTCPRGQ